MAVGEDGYRLESRLFGDQGMFGTLDESLDFADGYFLSKAVGTFLQHRHPSVYACVASDAHPLSVPLESEIVRGLLECGVRVLSFSVSPTPLVRFAATELRAQVAISVTRGSLPETHSGVKIFLEGSALDAERALLLRNIAANGNWRKGSGGRLAKSEGVDAYTMRLFAETAWRQGNGARSGGGAVRRLLPRVLLAQSAHGGSAEVLGTIAEKLSAHAEQVLVLEDRAALHLALQEEREQVGFLFNSDGTALQAFVGGRGEISAEELFGLLLRGEAVSSRKRVVLADRLVGQRAVQEWESAWKTGGLRVVRCSEFGAGMLACLSTKRGASKRGATRQGATRQGATRQGATRQGVSKQGASEGGISEEEDFSLSSCATFSCDGHMALGDSYYPFEDAFYVALRFLSGLATGLFRMDALGALPSRGARGEAELLRIFVAKTHAEGGDSFFCNKDALLMQLRAWVKAWVKTGVKDWVKAGVKTEGGEATSEVAEEEVEEAEEVERKLSCGRGRWIVRVARFEEGLVARCEGEDREALERAREDLRGALSSCGIDSVLSKFVLS